MAGLSPCNIPGENLKINGERLWDSLMEMAKIGPGVAGGNNRQTLTDEDSEGRHLFQKWCEEAGMTMGVDEMGNMFARREGTDPDALPVYVGSHLDTQPTGGKYDGVLGVLGGLEIIRTLNDLDIKTKHPIVVTNWTNEEGHALCARDAGLGRLRRQARRRTGPMTGSTPRANASATSWSASAGRARRRSAPQDARLLRAAYRTGPDPGGRGQGYRRRHPRAGPALDRMHGDGQGKPHRLHADAMRKNAGRGLALITELVHEIAMKNQPNAVGASGISTSTRTRATSSRARWSSPSTCGPIFSTS
jgi:N-carbamoyl-L-amino-acid hydrolase